MLNIFQFFGYKSGSKITDNLFISDKHAALDKTFLNNNNIDVIVNCSKNIPFIKNYDVQKFRIPLNDDCVVDTICKMTLYLKDIIPQLNLLLENNKKILIHCRCGMQRSATVLVSLIMYRYRIRLEEAYKIIKNKRMITFFPFPNFQLSLDMYEKYLIYTKRI